MQTDNFPHRPPARPPMQPSFPLGYALLIGLTKVDPKAYSGWDGSNIAKGVTSNHARHERFAKQL
jgi:hypothetical protein